MMTTSRSSRETLNNPSRAEILKIKAKITKKTWYAAASTIHKLETKIAKLELELVEAAAAAAALTASAALAAAAAATADARIKKLEEQCEDMWRVAHRNALLALGPEDPDGEVSHRCPGDAEPQAEAKAR